jgi:ADP-heptose:LPS heptosyltransferase
MTPRAPPAPAPRSGHAAATAAGADPASPARVAVFRALVLGDLLCAVPALRAMRRAWPRAEVTLVGLPWARELAERLPMVDRFIDFPGYPGLPESTPDIEALPGFLHRMQQERFDLLVQLHGSGTLTNPLLAACGARRMAGFVEPGAFTPAGGCFVPWPRQGHEIERLLSLVDALGLPRAGTALEFPLDDADRAALAAVWPGAEAGRPYACVHAGAQLPSRRWPAARFAAVADRLAECGLEVVLTGGPGEVPLVREVAATMRRAAVDLAGRTTLWTLGALVERARLVVCNDTGISHVAAALGTQSVVVSSGADVERWAPLDRARHAVLWQPVPCRPCSFAHCPYGHECAQAITSDDVLDAVRTTLSMEAANA